jgi:hypothetical protein
MFRVGASLSADFRAIVILGGIEALGYLLAISWRISNSSRPVSELVPRIVAADSESEEYCADPFGDSNNSLTVDDGDSPEEFEGPITESATRKVNRSSRTASMTFKAVASAWVSGLIFLFVTLRGRHNSDDIFGTRPLPISPVRGATIEAM